MFETGNLSSLRDSIGMIGSKKLLISAGDLQNFNTMTASWGTIGVIWNQPIFQVFIRPQRYTYRFAEENAYFTVSVLEGNREEAYRICGTRSGRDGNKVESAGLHAISVEHGVTFEEATDVFICRKIAIGDLDPSGFLDKTIAERFYPNRDFHRVYCGAIEAYLKRND